MVRSSVVSNEYDMIKIRRKKKYFQRGYFSYSFNYYFEVLEQNVVVI